MLTSGADEMQDKSGFIDADEMIKMTTALGVPMSRAQIESVMRDMDADGNNQIDFDEFHSWWTLQSSDTKGIISFTTHTPMQTSFALYPWNTRSGQNVKTPCSLDLMCF
eukprot:SAG31_NODE_170_length_21415_cov_8.230813_17_plen_109_part_00